MIVRIGPHDCAAVAAVASHRTWRHGQTKLHAELRGDALLTPGAVVSGHFRDESLHLDRDAGAPTVT